MSPFRKFSFLSPLKTSITFPSRGETATTPSPGLLNPFKSLFVAVTGEPRGRLGALSAVQPASQPVGRGSPYICFSVTGRAKGAPQGLMRLTLGIMVGGRGLRKLSQGWPVRDGAHPAGHPPPMHRTPPRTAQGRADTLPPCPRPQGATLVSQTGSWEPWVRGPSCPHAGCPGLARQEHGLRDPSPWWFTLEHGSTFHRSLQGSSGPRKELKQQPQPQRTSKDPDALETPSPT